MSTPKTTVEVGATRSAIIDVLCRDGPCYLHIELERHIRSVGEEKVDFRAICNEIEGLIGCPLLRGDGMPGARAPAKAPHGVIVNPATASPEPAKIGSGRAAPSRRAVNRGAA